MKENEEREKHKTSIDKLIQLIQETPNNYFLTALFVIAAVIMGALNIPYYGWFIFAAFISADLL